MKKLLGLLFLIVNLSATAQYSPNPGNYGSKFNRIKPLIAAHIPERDSTPPPDTDSTSTIYFDTVHLQLLVARHGLTYGFSGGSVIDTASLSNRINNCVLIANMPTYLASYLLSSSFDSMAILLSEIHDLDADGICQSVFSLSTFTQAPAGQHGNCFSVVANVVGIE